MQSSVNTYMLFSKFSLNEAMNIVYTVCFIETLYLIKTGQITHLPNMLTVVIPSVISFLSLAIISMLHIGNLYSHREYVFVSVRLSV